MRSAAVGTSPLETPYMRYFPDGTVAKRVLLSAASVLLGMTVLLLQTSMVATAGFEVEQLAKHRDAVMHLNQELEAEVASLRSLDRIEREARGRLKMITPASYVFVTVDAVPAKPSDLLAKSMEEARPQAPRQPKWWENLPMVLQFLRNDS